MASITTRAGKGSPLTNAEVDANFTNLNTELGQKLPLSGGTMTGAIAFAAGQTWPTFNQNTTGSAASLTTGRTIGMTGDVTWTSGSFNGTANVTGTATLANSGVTAGTYTKVTVDAKGRVTTGASLSANDIPSLSYLPLSGGTLTGTVASTGFIGQLFGAASGAPDTWIWSVSPANPTWGIYYNEGTPDAIEFKAAGTTTASIFLDTGAANFAGALTQNNNQVLHAGNYTSYAPSLTGSGASGTWGVSVTGNAATATTLQTARTINGVSFNGSANIKTSEWVHSDRDFASGTLVTTDINYAVTNGDPFVLEIRGNSYGDAVPYDIQYQGYIYSDTIINHGGYSNGTNITGLVAINVGGNLCFWWPRQSYWNGFNVRVYTAYATVAVNRVTSITSTAKPTSTKEVALSANIRQSLHSGNYNSYSPTLTGTGASGTWGISITGSAATLTTARTIAMTGDVTYTSGSFNGSANVTGTATIADATVSGKLLTGYTAGTNTALAATDSILAAFGKVQGQINARLTGNQTITLSGDASGSGATAIAVTLANSGVTAGTYTKVTVDAKGRVTAGASLASADVTTALGYTPYNSTNPNGYITSSALSSYLPLTGGSLTGPLLVSGTGGFPTDALNTAGNVPIVAKVGTNDTFFGALNQYGYQTFAVNITGATNTSTTRGVIDFYTKTNGSWTAAMQLNTASARFPGAVRIGNTGTPEGSFDFIAGSDVRWLARAGRLDCVNDANTSYQSGTLRGLNLYFRTADDVTRFSVNSDGRLYFNNGSASRGTDGYVLSVRSDSLAAPLRMGGYLEWLSDVGAIGTSYFNSDARLKKNIAPTQVAARDVIDAIEFKQFEWNEFTDLDGVRVPLGVIAQQLREVNPNFVSEMTDSTLGVRDPELLTYALKAVQELSSELKMVQQELARLKGAA